MLVVVVVVVIFDCAETLLPNKNVVRSKAGISISAWADVYTLIVSDV